MQRFLDNVPRSYFRHIQGLDLCTQSSDGYQEFAANTSLRAQTDAVISFLIACPRLEQLALRLAGSLDKGVITSFSYLPSLKRLTIANCCEEDKAPLYVLPLLSQ